MTRTVRTHRIRVRRPVPRRYEPNERTRNGSADVVQRPHRQRLPQRPSRIAVLAPTRHHDHPRHARVHRRRRHPRFQTAQRRRCQTLLADRRTQRPRRRRDARAVAQCRARVHRAAARRHREPHRDPRHRPPPRVPHLNPHAPRQETSRQCTLAVAECAQRRRPLLHPHRRRAAHALQRRPHLRRPVAPSRRKPRAIDRHHQLVRALPTHPAAADRPRVPANRRREPHGLPEVRQHGLARRDGHRPHRAPRRAHHLAGIARPHRDQRRRHLEPPATGGSARSHHLPTAWRMSASPGSGRRPGRTGAQRQKSVARKRPWRQEWGGTPPLRDYFAIMTDMVPPILRQVRNGQARSAPAHLN